jgi:Xaa-Pro aminopeptidase
MFEEMQQRLAEFQRRLRDEGVDVAVVTDEDSIAWFAGYWGYLGVEFGRPTMLVVPASGAPSVITPLMESEMAGAMTWIDDVLPWQDARGPEHWDEVLAHRVKPAGGIKVGIERLKMPALVSSFVAGTYGADNLVDVSPVIGDMRMIKSASEIAIMRQAGQIAIAMLEGGRARLGQDVAEYEVALGVIESGTRKAAGFLTDAGFEAFISPMVHNLQVLQSGKHTAMVHRRPNVHRLAAGEPIYFCFCGIVNFKQYKLGFDREYFIGSVSDEQAMTYETCIAAQQAALAAIRPGVVAEDVHKAANEVYQSAGFAPGYRTGRAIGISNLESPELKDGDRTVLREGMTFAVDGGITVPGEFGARVGDSIVVTKEGFEFFTPYSKDLTVI